MITARFADALDELAAAYGFRTHRSWWAAGDRIEAVRWSRGTGTATLAGGIVAPVSRAQATALREAGWSSSSGTRRYACWHFGHPAGLVPQLAEPGETRHAIGMQGAAT